MIILYPLILSLASRFHGGGFLPTDRWIRALTFAFLVAVPFVGSHPATIILTIIFAYIGKNLGHEDFWMMGTATSRPDDNFLTKLIKLTNLKRDSLPWCWCGMALKGAITTIGTLSIPIIILYAISLPLSYHIARRTKWGSELAEYLSGLMLGMTIITFI